MAAGGHSSLTCCNGLELAVLDATMAQARPGPASAAGQVARCGGPADGASPWFVACHSCAINQPQAAVRAVWRGHRLLKVAACPAKLTREVHTPSVVPQCCPLAPPAVWIPSGVAAPLASRPLAAAAPLAAALLAAAAAVDPAAILPNPPLTLQVQMPCPLRFVLAGVSAAVAAWLFCFSLAPHTAEGTQAKTSEVCCLCGCPALLPNGRPQTCGFLFISLYCLVALLTTCSPPSLYTACRRDKGAPRIGTGCGYCSTSSPGDTCTTHCSKVERSPPKRLASPQQQHAVAGGGSKQRLRAVAAAPSAPLPLLAVESALLGEEGSMKSSAARCI